MTVVTDNEVERVAEAIHEEQRNTVLAALGIAENDPRAMQRPQWQQETDGFRRVYRTLARAALAASDRDVLVAALRKIAEMTDIEADFDGFEAREIAVAALATATAKE